jgi:hypothetical protein
MLYSRVKHRATSLFRKSAAGETKIFVFSVMILFLLAGLVIPGALIASSVQEFSFVENYTSPFPFIINTLLQSAGIFLLWPLCFYALFSKSIKEILTVLMSFLCVIALVNTFIFPGNYGFLTPMLRFSNPVRHGTVVIAINILASVMITAVFVILFLSKKKAVFYSFQLIALISLAGFGTFNAVKIQREYSEFASRETANTSTALESVYSFSKIGKNVLVIMLDKAISGYVPYIFDERPELIRSFGGFTFYPNCVSFGRQTLVGAPGIFGGYEYTPSEMQKRPGEPLVKKHDEALLVLPKIFLDEDYAVTVTDPPFAGYSWVPDLRIFDNYPEVRAENVVNKYSAVWLKQHEDLDANFILASLQNNLIRFSLFKFAPPAVRSFIYDDGRWFGTGDMGLSLPRVTIDNYAALDILPDITTISGDNINTLMLITNNLTHEPAFFEAPDYIPVTKVSDRGRSRFAGEDHYHVNIAAYLLLGKWFTFLKENGVYDNTRIIIVSDHGTGIFSNFPGNIILPNGECLELYNALLMVKDFNTSGGFTTDNTFMTNADVPILATDGLVANPINPFTRNPLRSDKEDGADITITNLPGGMAQPGQRLFKIKTNEWLHVHDNIFDPANWR